MIKSSDRAAALLVAALSHPKPVDDLQCELPSPLVRTSHRTPIISPMWGLSRKATHVFDSILVIFRLLRSSVVRIGSVVASGLSEWAYDGGFILVTGSYQG